MKAYKILVAEDAWVDADQTDDQGNTSVEIFVSDDEVVVFSAGGGSKQMVFTFDEWEQIKDFVAEVQKEKENMKAIEVVINAETDS